MGEISGDEAKKLAKISNSLSEIGRGKISSKAIDTQALKDILHLKGFAEDASQIGKDLKQFAQNHEKPIEEAIARKERIGSVAGGIRR